MAVRGGSEQIGGRGGEKWLDSRYILQIETSEFASGLERKYKSKESRMTPRFLA